MIIFSTSILQGCYPDQEIFPEETDTVYTTYLPGTPFYDLEYYMINDEILRSDTTDFLGNNQYDASILSRVELNLNSRGFKKAVNQDSSLIDFFVIVSDLSRIDIAYYWHYIPYGYLYPNSNDFDNNAFYPLPPPDNISVMAVNGLLIDFIYNEYQTEQDSSKVIWRGMTNGIHQSNMEERIIYNIDKMFFQSPYLKSNKQ